MREDELAFAVEQIAGMVDSGIPLEGALARVAADLRRGRLRTELGALRSDLARGVPFADAVTARQLPPFCRQMLLVGGRSNRLPELLTHAADYYRQRSEIALRLTGLMVYPALVLTVLLAFSLFLAVVTVPCLESLLVGHGDMWFAVPPRVLFAVRCSQWGPLVVLAVLAAGAVLCATVPALRSWVAWHVPPFRQTRVANLAGMLSACLAAGVTLPEALALVAGLESPAAGRELAGMQATIEQGGSVGDALQRCRLFPPLAEWIVTTCGERVEDGFAAVARIYRSRAGAYADLFLYAALPVSIIFLGGLLCVQLFGPFRLMGAFLGIAGGGLG